MTISRVNKNTSAIRASLECDLQPMREAAIALLCSAVEAHETYEAAGASLGMQGQSVRRLLGIAGLKVRPGEKASLTGKKS